MSHALFAQSLTTTLESFWNNAIVCLLFCLLGLAMLFLVYRVADWITPGSLGQELLGSPQTGKQPNLALAVVAAAIVLGASLIIAASIH